MASISKKLSNNVEGDYFVDSSCINCDTCRQLESSVFSERDGYSFVLKQPFTIKEVAMSEIAIIACPSGSIGKNSGVDRRALQGRLPLLIDDNVYYNGFNSPKSYGANSYFITHEDGNWLVDSPRYSSHLVSEFEKKGGVKYIFLTHRDDVADAEKYAKKFGSRRIIHHDDLDAQKDAERKITGIDVVEIGEDFKIIPTPGHTKGHQVLLYKNKFLFTGDHLYWRRDWDRLRASRSYCWWSWDEQVKSMVRLSKHDFEWILPGHGQRINLDKDEMRVEMAWLVNEIKKPDYW